MLLEILAGIVSMILNPWLGIIFYKLAGFSFEFTFSLLIVREIVYLVLVYCGFSWVVLEVSEGRTRKWIKKIKKCGTDIFFVSRLLNFLQKIIGRLENIFFVSRLLNFLRKIIEIFEKSDKIIEKIVNWITKRNKKVCCILVFIPIVPCLPTSVMIAVKLMKIRYGFMILCAAMLFKAFICCSVIYFFL